MDARRADFERDRETVERAAQDANLLVRFCFAYAADFVDALVDYLHLRLNRPADPALRLYELNLLYFFRERQERTRHGLSLSNAHSLADAHFHLALPELDAFRSAAVTFLDSKPTSRAVLTLLAEAHAAAGAIEEAEKVLARIRALGQSDTATATTFDRAFHDGLAQAADTAVAHDLPPLQSVRPVDPACRRVIYASGDRDYFETYGWSLLHAFRAHKHTNTQLVFHVMDATETEAAEIARRLDGIPAIAVGLSTEWSGLRTEPKSDAARVYYHAVRLIRFWQFLEAHPQVEAFMIDIDTLINGSVDGLFERLDGADVALAMLPARLETRNRVLGGYVGAAATMNARAYLKRVAGYIAVCRREQRAIWGIDQVALYAALMVMAQRTPLKVAPISADIVDGSFGADRLLWGAKIDASSPDYARVTATIARWSA